MLRRHSRYNFEGSVHFVTTVTRVRGNRFVEPDVCRLILETFEFYRSKHSVACLGYVLMPDHFHALVIQEIDTGTIPLLMSHFKRLTARKLLDITGEKNLWRERYDDVPVPGSEAIVTKMKYLHENPLRKGIVERFEDYPWSSSVYYYREESSIITLLT